MHVWDMSEAARDWFEQHQLQMAVDMSKRDTEERWLQHEVSIRIVERRLASKGLQRVNTPANGNCFLIAASWSAGIHIDHFALRQQVVSYLGTYRCLFSSSSTSNSFLQPLLVLRSYVARWPWGHDLCVMASSHLLLRPAPVFSNDFSVFFGEWKSGLN